MHIVRNYTDSETEESQITPYIAENWYTEQGAKKKLRRLENKGLPSLYNWRFLTLTVDPLKFKTSESAYHYIKERMRYFIRSIKQTFEIDDLAYIWKLEFQQNGMPHWHMLLNYKKPLCVNTIFKLWGYGGVKIVRCKDKHLPYTFKYIAKEANDLPSWFLELSRPRVFQSSGFFPKTENQNGTSVSEPSDMSRPERKKETLGQRLERYRNSIQVISLHEGKLLSKIYLVHQNFYQFMYGLIRSLKHHFRYDSPFSCFVPSNYINYIMT